MPSCTNAAGSASCWVAAMLVTVGSELYCRQTRVYSVFLLLLLMRLVSSAGVDLACQGSDGVAAENERMV